MPTHLENNQVPIESPVDDYDEKNLEEIVPATDEKGLAALRDPAHLTDAQKAQIRERYGRKAAEDDIAPAKDVQMILDRVVEMTDDEAMGVIIEAIEVHKIDPNFPPWTMEKLKHLVLGYKACDMSEEDWSFDVRTEAAMLKYHSPYPEVRAVTDPYNDPTEPCETFRAYCLGLFFMLGATGLNTFFSQRQPAISLSASVMQLLLAPCGWTWARVVPNWHIKLGKWRIPINQGPWTFKEQSFATILFTIVNGAGSAQTLVLAQRLPQFFDLHWVNWGYEILISLSMQAFGFSLAGLCRRIVIYPPQAIWPEVLPKIALNRALIVNEKRESINGWKISRYHFFLACFGLMFVWFWVPNTLFTALHGFNWMCWIAPDNYNLNMITGFYGGMGFSPLATFDWNVAGTNMLVTPWFSTIQQYLGQAFGGLLIIAMHFRDLNWAGYMPINSNQLWTNVGGSYNTSAIMGADQRINVEAYKSYGPPYWSGAALLTEAGWYAWYMFSIPLVLIRYWTQIKVSMIGMWRTIRNRSSVYDGQLDAHCRMMAEYPEVPEWWYFCTLLVCLAFGLIATQAWPTELPAWALFAVLLFHIILLIPATVIESYANVRMDGGILFLVLAGLWFVGNPRGTMVGLMYGTQFGQQTDNFITDLKFGHYAKIPPRAMFRGQLISVLINCFIWLALTNWMIEHFQLGSFCEFDNKQHMVCSGTWSQYELAQMYGGFGARNLFQLYPVLPWIFLGAGVVGILWACIERWGPALRERFRQTWSENRFRVVNNFVFLPMSIVGWLDPAIFLHGLVNWTGGTNLSYSTQGVYISYIFMNRIRRRYSAWWQKYNYLLENGFDLGVAISGIIQTLIFVMGNGGKGYSITWWGNTVATNTLDYKSYTNDFNVTHNHINPAIGYFGLSPEEYPMHF